MVDNALTDDLIKSLRAQDGQGLPPFYAGLVNLLQAFIEKEREVPG